MILLQNDLYQLPQKCHEARGRGTAICGTGAHQCDQVPAGGQDPGTGGAGGQTMESECEEEGAEEEMGTPG